MEMGEGGTLNFVPDLQRKKKADELLHCKFKFLQTYKTILRVKASPERPHQLLELTWTDLSSGKRILMVQSVFRH